MNILSPIFVLLFLASGLIGSPPAWAAMDIHARIKQVQAERTRLKAVRERLESRVGQLGQALKHLDQALIKAKAETRQSTIAVGKADAHLNGLMVRRKALERRVDGLRRSMAHEAAAAYRHAGGPPLWLDVMFGASIAKIPHRQYMLASLMTAQAEHRRAFAQGVTDLAGMEQRVQQQRSELEKLRRARRARQQELIQRQKAKHVLWEKVRHDARLQRQRDVELARQEAALRKLLEGFGSTLLFADTTTKWVSIRKRKGRLPWPVKGKIIARFGSRPAPGRPGLAGVELAPRHGSGQVKAIAAGQVRYADWFGGYGLMLIVDHGDGLMTVYAHNDVLYKSLGDWVEAGDALADAGSTGWVRDVRLYFEMRDGGNAVNPVRWCRK